MTDERKRKELYNNLLKDNYDLPAYDKFTSDMADENLRRELYDNLIEDNYDLPAFEQFTSDIIGDKINATTPTPQPTAKQTTATKQPTAQKPTMTVEQRSKERLLDLAEKKFGTRDENELRQMAQEQFGTTDPKEIRQIAKDYVQGGGLKPVQKKTTTVEQETENDQPAGPEEFAKQMDSKVANLVVREQAISDRAKALEKGNKPFGQHSTVGTELLPTEGYTDLLKQDKKKYYTEHGDIVDSPLEQWGANHVELLYKKAIDKAMEGVGDEAENVYNEAIKQAEQKSDEAASKIREQSAYIVGNPEDRAFAQATGTVITTRAIRMQETDMEKMSKDAWNKLGAVKQQRIIDNIVSVLKEYNIDVSQKPGSMFKNVGGITEKDYVDFATILAKQQIDAAIYQAAVKGNAPQNVQEYFAKNVLETNMVTKFLTYLARKKAGTRGDMEAHDVAMQQFGQEHTGARIGSSVLGVAIDPTTWIAGGVGGGVAKGTMWLGGRLLGQAFVRKGAPTLLGKIIIGSAAGAGNFATFEGLNETLDQLKWGGTHEVDEETGRYVYGDYSVGDILKSTGKGVLLGSAMGITGTVIGNVGDVAVRGTTSTIGKAGIRTAQLGVSTVADATIFSTPEWISGDGNAFDVWTDNLATMIGFKLHGIVKSAPQQVRALKSAPKEGVRAGFETRLRQMLDGNRNDIALTADERAELKAKGYTDLKELVEEYERKNTADNSEVKGHRTEIIDGEEVEIPLNRFEELMNDSNISEAARAKMYYYITGRQLPMSTIIGSTFTELKDGTYRVESYGVNGTITSRTYKVRHAAEAEQQRIDRQAELNTVAKGETMFAQYMDKLQMLDACKLASENIGVNPEQLYKLMKSNPESMSNVEKAWASEVMKKYKEVGETAFYPDAEYYRTKIEGKHNVNIYDALAKEPNRRTESEKAAVKEYAQSLFNIGAPKWAEKYNNLQLNDVFRGFDYGDADLKYLHKYPAGEAKGYNADAQERRDINIELAMTDTPTQSEEEAWNGVVRRINDDADYAAAQSRELAKKSQNKADQSAILVTINEKDANDNDKQVFVVDGQVTFNEDGTLDKEHSDKSIMVFDPKMGETRMIDPTSDMVVMGLVRRWSAEDIENDIQQRRDEYVQSEIDKAQGKITVNIGDELPMGDGTVGIVAAISEDGEEITVAGADENGNPKQEVLTRSELQEASDQAAIKDYMQRHPNIARVEESETAEPQAVPEEQRAETDEQQTTEETPQTNTMPQGYVEGVPDDYTNGMEVTYNEDGELRHAVVLGRVRFKNDHFIPDENGNIVELLITDSDDVVHMSVGELNGAIESYYVAQPEDTAAEEPQDIVEPATESETPQTPVEAETESEAPITPTEPQTSLTMPMREVRGKQIPAYEQATAEQTYDYIYNQAGLNEQDADKFVQNKLDEANEALNKAQKGEPQIGTDIDNYKAQHAKWEQDLQAAQRNKDMWDQVKAMRGIEDVQTPETPIEPTTPTETTPVEETAPVAEESTEPQQPEQPTPAPDIATAAQQMYDTLVARGGNIGSKIEATIKDRENTVAEAKKKLDKAQRDFDNAPFGKEDKAQNKLSAAQAEYDDAVADKALWDRVKVKYNFANTKIESTGEQKPVAPQPQKPKRNKTLTPFQKRMKEVGEPRTVEEAVLMEIAGGLKFRWGKKHEQRGIGDLFKYSESERRKKIGMIAKDGYSVETFVEAIQQGYFDGTEIAYMARNMDYSDLTSIVEDALMSVDSRADALDKIEARRAAEQEAEDEYARGMADAYAEDQGFTDYDELQDYEEYLKTYEITEAEYNEKNRIFAEKYQEENDRTRQTIYPADNGENERNDTRGEGSVDGESGGLLQETPLADERGLEQPRQGQDVDKSDNADGAEGGLREESGRDRGTEPAEQPRGEVEGEQPTTAQTEGGESTAEWDSHVAQALDAYDKVYAELEKRDGERLRNELSALSDERLLNTYINNLAISNIFGKGREAFREYIGTADRYKPEKLDDVKESNMEAAPDVARQSFVMDLLKAELDRRGIEYKDEYTTKEKNNAFHWLKNNVPEFREAKERQQLEERLAEERRQRILSEGTTFDKIFGLAPVSEEMSVDDIDTNVKRIVQGLKDNEGNKDLDKFYGFAYQNNFRNNAGNQVHQYIFSLSGVIPDETLKAWLDSHDIKSKEDIISYGESLYDNTTRTETPTEEYQAPAPAEGESPLDYAERVAEGQKQHDEKQAETKAKTKIEDVGEKIGGARKDLAQQIAGKIRLDADTFPKMFPKFDLAKLVESGLDPKLAAAVMYLRQEAYAEYKSRAKRQTKEKALSGAKFFAAYAKQVLENGNTDVNFTDSGWEFTDYGKDVIRLNIDLYSKIHEKLGDDIFKLDLSGYRIVPITESVLRYSKFYRRNEKGEEVEYTPAFEARTPHGSDRFEKGELNRAIDYLLQKLENSVSYDKAHPYKLLHYYTPGANNSSYIGVKLGGKVVALTEKSSSAETSKYLREHEAELQEKARRLDEERKQNNKEKGEEKDKWKPQLNLGGGRSRVGEDYRGGRDIEAEEFRNTFGFRGVEFGNYVSQKDRQRFINEAYDAFMDLAALLGVSPKALGLGGQLGFAIGARGGGGKNAAHYEPELNVINLTKTQGAGALAHEWWHALDYYFNRIGDRRKTPATAVGSASGFSEGVRKEMKEAFLGLMDKIKNSDYYKRSKNLESNLHPLKMGEGYYDKPTELGARAFEDYVSRKLTDKGQVNDFLSSHTPEEKWDGEADTYPYPTGKDADAIDDRFDNLFSTMQERTDEQGNVALAEPAAQYQSYTTRGGVQLYMTSLMPDKAQQAATQPTKTPRAATPTSVKLRKLQPGETCHVERRYEENKMFSFTGKEKIESQDDVAFIFKQLETAAVENTFVVFVKNGKPTIFHIGMGAYTAAQAPLETVVAAFNKMKPDTVTFVHNHPSGALKASREDVSVYQKLKTMFGDKVRDGIIIDTTSGQYGTFDDSYSATHHSMPQSQEGTVPLKIYSFSKQVFDKNWNPQTAFAVHDSSDIATFISSHRLGDHPKMGLLVLDNQNRVTGNFFLPWTSISEMKQDATLQISNLTNLAGGNRGVLFGNYKYTRSEDAKLRYFIDELKQWGTPLLDILHVEPSYYHSAYDTGVMEQGKEYGKGGERETDSPLYRTLDPESDEVKQTATTEEKRQVTERLSEKLHTPITIIEDVSEITHPDPAEQQRRRNAKGWYNPATGEVVIVLPNNRNTEDVAATVFHETAGHKGLREIVGKEYFNLFLNEVYTHLRGDLKQQVDAEAYREYADSGFKKDYEQCRRTATEELITRIGEKQPEDITDEELTLWQRIKEAVRKILDQFLGGNLKLPKWLELGDNELRYMFWRSRQHMEKKTEDYVQRAEDAAKRAELGLDDGVLFSDGVEQTINDDTMGLQERITATHAKLAEQNTNDALKRSAALRAIDKNLSSLRKAMSLQKEFDRTTVKRVADLAKVLIRYGYIDTASRNDMTRLLAAVKNATGHTDISRDVQKIFGIMVDSQLRQAEDMLDRLQRIKGSKVDARGVQVQGVLDVAGQQMMKTFKETKGFSEDAIADAIADAENRMASDNKIVADNAANELVGLQFARQYIENIKKSKEDERTLRTELADAKQATERNKGYEASLEEAIRLNKIERIEAYHNLLAQMSGGVRTSIDNAAEFKKNEKERINNIHHLANSDMQGKPDSEHDNTAGSFSKQLNNIIANTIAAPFATFNEMMRMFGAKSSNGEGYLFNHFSRGAIDCRQKEIRGVKQKYAALDAKAKEIFGEGVKTWADLMEKVGKMEKYNVRFKDGKEYKNHEMHQGNLMNIYMVDKMTDGRMKLRKMGIDESQVEAITQALDPRLKEIADWLQDNFLVDCRNEYNETHKRLFGSSMASIDNYFPLRINSRSRHKDAEKEDAAGESNSAISTKTGAIIKRTLNTTDLDLTNADALHIILDHVAEMEHWNAFAELNRDLNTLRSYKRFENQVKNMTTIYGNGETLWKKFGNVSKMVVGSYRPPEVEYDKAAVAFAQGVTAAKVSFRINTALKQLLSLPAYLPYVNAAGFYHSIANNLRNQETSFQWCMENLPMFRERWESRVSGDPRLAKTAMDWRSDRANWLQKISRVGMFPNALIDAITVSIGAHAVYETRLNQYLKWGYPREQAEKKALQDAEMSYNETQQSSEGGFTSTFQVDRTWYTVLFTIFRNASMSYQRRLHGALRNLKHNFTKGQRAETIDFLAKQIAREGIDEDVAKTIARKQLGRDMRKNYLDIATFGFIVQLAWNLGGNMWYLLFGDDDDEKSNMWKDIFAKTLFGSVEGVTGGDVISELGKQVVRGDFNPNSLNKDMPLTSDVLAMIEKMAKGRTSEALNDIINIAVQAGTGFNPQTFTDGIIAIVDAADGDMDVAREAALCAMRILQVPQSQTDKYYFDEINLSGKEASKMTFEELATRYARYKVKRSQPYSFWNWDDEELLKKKEDKAIKIIKERVAGLPEAEQDSVLAHNYDNGDYKTRKIVGDIEAKRQGGAKAKDNIGNNDNMKAYNDMRDYVDLAEDIALQVEIKEAKDRGDEVRRKILQSYKTSLDQMRKAMSVEGVDKNELMKTIREVRGNCLKEYGFTPTHPETGN